MKFNISLTHHARCSLCFRESLKYGLLGACWGGIRTPLLHRRSLSTCYSPLQGLGVTILTLLPPSPLQDGAAAHHILTCRTQQIRVVLLKVKGSSPSISAVPGPTPVQGEGALRSPSPGKNPPLSSKGLCYMQSNLSLASSPELTWAQDHMVDTGIALWFLVVCCWWQRAWHRMEKRG